MLPPLARLALTGASPGAIGPQAMAVKGLDMSKNMLKSLVVDIALLLEGQEVPELPERVMATFRLFHPDFNNVQCHLDDLLALNARREPAS
eukprot:1081374-Prorocentrum_minimum.AAC.1